ncbi:acyl CoA binding protein-domain-containing protein [Abortiporus biennis]|nr:acyl CoA binding protein-domain-containing protein [Abortiporus biennis]
MSTSSGPSETFTNAANYLSSAPSLSKVSNAVKLELYGLFKYITVSPRPNVPRPSIFDITSRSKWDAWNAASKTYETAKDAEARYLQLARELGWTEATKSFLENKNQSTEENIWDDDTQQSRGQSSRDAGGLGPTVSTMAAEGEEERKHGTIHELVVSGNIDELESVLLVSPQTDLNAKDEFEYTPLHLACDRGHIEIVKLLLRKGVDRSITDPDDFTAIELARVAEHEEIVSLLEDR